MARKDEIEEKGVVKLRFSLWKAEVEEGWKLEPGNNKRTVGKLRE